MRNNIIEIISVRINENKIDFVDVTMIVKKENSEAEEKITKTFTRAKWRQVKHNGFFND